MAAHRFQSSAVLFMLFCLSSLYFYEVKAMRTKKKIYIDMLSQNSCFRLLNATHQVGCSSGQEGNTGVVHYMQTEEDWRFVLHTGSTPPYVPVLETVNFTLPNVRNLTYSGRVNGIIVISVNLTSDPFAEEGGFSADKTCPNDAYGYYNNTEEAGCKQVKWNPAGSGLMFENLDIPIFSLTQQSDVDTVLKKCWEPFNKPVDGKTRTYPLCAVQLVAAMTAAQDTQTCVRRSNLITNLNPFVFCDPLGDKNVVATLKALPSNETRPEKSVIVVATRMDTMSLFHNEYPGADSTVTGIVTLLATAKALWSVQQAIHSNPKAKDVMFTFFQGEAFDYIGSSRMLYEMQGGRFPADFKADDHDLHLQKINLSHIAQFVELSQVGLRQDENSLWLHVDPFVRNSTEVQNLMEKLKDYGNDTNTTFQDTQSSLPLPPASLQRFLMASGNESFPSFVVTDHKTSFTNRYYNSRLDLPSEIAADYPSDLNETERYNATTMQSLRIAALATSLARYLYWASTGEEPAGDLEADIEEVNHMLYCFLHSPHCELFNMTISPDDADNLKKNKQPFPFYVSVSLQTNHVTSLVKHVLTYYTGQKVVNATKDTCKVTDNDERYSYIWMQGGIQGPKEERAPMCYKSTVLLSVAKSPAFEIDGYDWESGQYSTWTESRWDTFKLRVFLIPSKQFQTQVLSAGVVLLVVSLVVVYFINARAEVLFAHRGVMRDYLFDVNS